jgi:hypothetical protein
VRPGTSYCWYRYREEGFIPYFSQEGPPAYCNNCPGSVDRLGLSQYDPSAWRLFIETSERSLKAVLLHNGNVFGSAPAAHSVLFKESYEHLETRLFWIKYQAHNWQVCGDFKILSMLLGQQSGYTKYLRFTCEGAAGHGLITGSVGLAASRKVGLRFEKYCTRKSCRYFQGNSASTSH